MWVPSRPTKSPQRAARACRHARQRRYQDDKFFYRWHARFGTYVLHKTTDENYQTRQEISVVSLEFSTEKENDRERVISQQCRRKWTGGTVCIIGSSGEASAEQTRSRHPWRPSRSERDGETDGSCIAWLCVGKRQSNPCIDWNLLYLQVPDETVLSLIIFFL